MAWYYPKHSCGHDGERVQLLGKTDGRMRTLAGIERQPCPDCRAKAATELTPGLPGLIGSPKQVAWAAEIRASLAKHAPDRMAKLTDETKASWWIDHRAEIARAVDSARLS